ncbi:M15 family metallopeptidase [Afipia sp. GAS231]|uniref:M15 family metallopeptidase n=1 Tax=Afipia sp. GAS231 TaxID=1882747 RepID=UPI001FCD00E7|nr:M15 family metallopeptidase [Afipia sp. GAS231]
MPHKERRNMLIRICLALAVLLLPAAARAGSLPKGLVYLRDADPTIVQDIRYAGSHNFVGRPIKGYLAAECILSEAAAKALKAMQGKLAAKGLSLIVWDCYRPKRAVDDFLRWSRDPARTEMKAEFYPRTDKQSLFALGYLAVRSAHSRGSTVDLGIVPSSFSTPPTPAALPPLKPCTAPKGERFEDGTIDFGTGYDCLDVLGSTSNPRVGAVASANRQMLKAAMRDAGFRSYFREWWHFELANEPFNNGFDFEITASPLSEKPAR